MNSEEKQPQLEELEAPAQDLNAEESESVSGGFFKNAKKAKTSEATFTDSFDLTED